MAIYNITRNGSFSSITSDATLSGVGAGNRTLTSSELQRLKDNDTTSSGVTISTSESIWLKLDMSQRIKIDGIRLYTDTVTASGLNYINFYFKDEEGDNYSGATEGISNDYYYGTVPSPSAPRYLIATISGLDAELYEFVVYNDDYIVAFGQDGTQTTEYLSDTPIGETGDPQAVEIYNNSEENMPAVAYVCIDYTGVTADEYIEISTSQNGTYYDLDDGILMDDDQSTSTYNWGMGTYNGTGTDGPGDSVVITTTSVIDVEDKGDLPLASATASWYVGQNCWDYDPISRTIYAIGSDSVLQLHKYPIDDGVWTYIGEINPGCSSFTNVANMVYLDGYIYVIIRGNGQFGRYDLSGPANNWESLTSVPWLDIDPTRIGMCGDKSQYIYTVAFHGDVTYTHSFVRYDTTSSGWTQMDNGYSRERSGTGHRRACLAYDYDKDYIYADVGEREKGNYLQRYIVSSDSWQTTYINIDAITNATSDYNDHQSHTYYDGYIIFGHAETGSRIYYYHIDTNTFSYFVSGIAGFYNPGRDDTYNSPYVLATDNPTSGGEVVVWLSQMTTDRGKMYLLDGLSVGNLYTTPIIKLEDKFMASYIIIDSDGEISVDGVAVDTIEVKSHDTAPIPIYESYLTYTEAADIHAVIWSPYDNTYTDREPWTYTQLALAEAMAADPTDGRYAISWGYGSFGTEENSALRIWNRSGTLLSSVDTGINYYYHFNIVLQFEGEHGLWAYGNYNVSVNRILRHFDADLSQISNYSESQIDFLYDLATETNTNGRGCWYTNSIDNTLVHMNSDCTKLKTIYLNSPRSVARTTSGGVWVHDSTLDKVIRYDWNGDKVSEFTLPTTALYNNVADLDRMSEDFNDGFWYRQGDMIRHVTSAGVVNVGPVYVTDSNRLKGTTYGCFVHSTDDNMMYWINMNGQIETSRSMSSSESALIDIFNYSHTEFLAYKETYIPASYDPVWGTGGTAEWKEVPKDGYFLPKYQYHQFRITLRSSGAALNKITMAPAIKVDDIQAGSYRTMYIRTNIPIGADITNYSSGLKTWWGVED